MAVNGDEIDNAVGEDTHGANSYFASFRAIQDSIGRLKAATEERLADMTENDPNFAAWKEAYSIGLGKGASPASNGIAIGWNSTAGSVTTTSRSDPCR